MKKVLCLLLVLVMALGCAGIGASAAEYGIVLNNNVALVVGSTTAIANNTLVTLAAAPVREGSEVLVPGDVVPLLNGSASYDASTERISMTFGDKNVTMRLGSRDYILNGRVYTAAAAPRLEGGSVLIPAFAVARDIIGKVVFYDEATKLLLITNRAEIKNSVADAAVISMIANAITSRNLPPITVPTSYELDWGNVEETTLAGPGTTAPTVSTTVAAVANVTATQEPEAENNALKAFDGNIDTRWACDGDGEITADLGSAQNIVEIKIAWWKWEERSAHYELEISTDGNNYTSLFSGDAKSESMYETHAVNKSARYVRVKSHGNTASNWNSLLECEIYVPGASTSSQSGAAGGKLNSSTGSKLSINGNMVKASAEPEAANPGRNIADSNSSSVWAAQGSANAVIDLGSEQQLSCVGVQMKAYDDGRAIKFGVDVSADGSSYTSLFNGQSADGGNVMEYIAANGAKARYVRINVSGSTTGEWASVAEVEVYTGSGAEATAPTTGGSYQNMSNINGEFVLIDSASGNALAVSGDDFALELRANTKDSRQLWTKENNSHGTALKNKGTGTYMDVAEQSRDEGGQICVWEGNDGDNQAWNLELDGNGYHVKSVMSGLYLSVNGSSIQQRNRNSATKWIAADPNAAPAVGGAVINGEFKLAVYGSKKTLTVGDDDYTLSVEADSSDAKQLWTKEDGGIIKNKGCGTNLDVAGESIEEGAQIGVWEANGGANQVWTLEQDGDGYYVKSNLSNLYLALDGSNVVQKPKTSATKWAISGDKVEIVVTENTNPNVPTAITSEVDGNFRITIYGTNTVLTLNDDTSVLSIERNKDANNQIWYMDSNSHGFTLKNKLNDKALDVPGQSMDAGKKISVWEDNDGENQAWVLEKVGNYYYIKNVMSGLYLVGEENGVRQKEFAYATKWALRPAK